MMRTALILAFVGGVAVLSAQGPAPAQSAPSFEVASVKSNTTPGISPQLTFAPGGRLVVVNMPLAGIIRFAYGVQPFELEDLPGWANGERFDINAAASTEVPRERIALMLRELLRDRFRLLVRAETRDAQVFALEQSRDSGQLGPKLRRSTTNCAVPPNGAPRCGVFGATGSGRLEGRGIPLERLATVLSGVIRDRRVIDRTGLTGAFDWVLEWTPERMPAAVPGAVSVPAAAPDAGAIFTAVREQLGLRLVSSRFPANVWIVERLERPTPD